MRSTERIGVHPNGRIASQAASLAPSRFGQAPPAATKSRTGRLGSVLAASMIRSMPAARTGLVRPWRVDTAAPPPASRGRDAHDLFGPAPLPRPMCRQRGGGRADEGARGLRAAGAFPLPLPNAGRTGPPFSPTNTSPSGPGAARAPPSNHPTPAPTPPAAPRFAGQPRSSVADQMLASLRLLALNAEVTARCSRSTSLRAEPEQFAAPQPAEGRQQHQRAVAPRNGVGERGHLRNGRIWSALHRARHRLP